MKDSLSVESFAFFWFVMYLCFTNNCASRKCSRQYFVEKSTLFQKFLVCKHPLNCNDIFARILFSKKRWKWQTENVKVEKLRFQQFSFIGSETCGKISQHILQFHLGQ